MSAVLTSVEGIGIEYSGLASDLSDKAVEDGRLDECIDVEQFIRDWCPETPGLHNENIESELYLILPPMVPYSKYQKEPIKIWTEVELKETLAKELFACLTGTIATDIISLDECIAYVEAHYDEDIYESVSE